jgi:hypothetical protein
MLKSKTHRQIAERRTIKLTQHKKLRMLLMNTKEMITIGLVTLTLLAGCNKEKESTSISTTTKSVTTPASPEDPSSTKSQESTSTTTTDTKGK